MTASTMSCFKEHLMARKTLRRFKLLVNAYWPWTNPDKKKIYIWAVRKHSQTFAAQCGTGCKMTAGECDPNQISFGLCCYMAVWTARFMFFLFFLFFAMSQTHSVHILSCNCFHNVNEDIIRSDLTKKQNNTPIWVGSHTLQCERGHKDNYNHDNVRMHYYPMLSHFTLFLCCWPASKHDPMKEYKTSAERLSYDTVWFLIVSSILLHDVMCLLHTGSSRSGFLPVGWPAPWYSSFSSLLCGRSGMQSVELETLYWFQIRISCLSGSRQLCQRLMSQRLPQAVVNAGQPPIYSLSVCYPVQNQNPLNWPNTQNTHKELVSSCFRQCCITALQQETTKQNELLGQNTEVQTVVKQRKVTNSAVITVHWQLCK